MIRTTEDGCLLPCHGRHTAFDRREPERCRRIRPASRPQTIANTSHVVKRDGQRLLGGAIDVLTEDVSAFRVGSSETEDHRVRG